MVKTLLVQMFSMNLNSANETSRIITINMTLQLPCNVCIIFSLCVIPHLLFFYTISFVSRQHIYYCITIVYRWFILIRSHHFYTLHIAFCVHMKITIFLFSISFFRYTPLVPWWTPVLQKHICIYISKWRSYRLVVIVQPITDYLDFKI